MLTGTLNPTSTSASWSESFEIVDDDTDEAVDLSDVDEITVTIRDPQSKTIMLTATYTGDDIELVDDGTFQVSFTADQMGGLESKTYDIGCTIEKDDQTVQFLIGHLPVLDGIVS